MAPILEVKDLAVAFPYAGGWRRAVDGVSVTVGEREVVGLVGESGCGKTLTALALLRLVPEPGRIVSGSIRVDGTDVIGAEERVLSRLRGGVVGFVFQEPAEALNPVRSVGFQVGEAARLHLGLSAERARTVAVQLLHEVGLEEASEVANAYPHQLSGGQRQRVLLACALSANPAVLVADEPTSALDTVAQQHFIERLVELQRSRGLAVLFISHDLALVSRLAERVVVLYAGETVEIADRESLLARPLHPYTRALLRVRSASGAGTGKVFAAIAGTVPAAGDWGSGCRFAARCPVAVERCRLTAPALRETDAGRAVRCLLAEGRENGRVDR